ncbi:MAG: class I SAM-dependent methyltransferase [Chlamydiota bacterium]
MFIDGNHDYDFVKEDIKLWLPKVRAGGILAGHDYDPEGKEFSGVKRAVDELLGTDISMGKGRVWLHLKN